MKFMMPEGNRNISMMLVSDVIGAKVRIRHFITDRWRKGTVKTINQNQIGIRSLEGVMMWANWDQVEFLPRDKGKGKA